MSKYIKSEALQSRISHENRGIDIISLLKKEKIALIDFIISIILDPLNYIGKGFIDDSDIDLLFKVLKENKIKIRRVIKCQKN